MKVLILLCALVVVGWLALDTLPSAIALPISIGLFVWGVSGRR
jgi:hypothetical protein